MSLVSGLQRGLVSGLCVGLNAHESGGFGSIVDGASLAAAMTFANAPAWLGKGDNPTGCTDLVGSNSLTDDTSPAKEKANADLGATVTGFTRNLNNAMDAANSTVLDVGAESSAILLVGQITEDNVGARSLMGKRTGGNPGYYLHLLSSNRIRYALDAGPSINEDTSSNILTAANGIFLALGVNDHNANTRQLYTNVDDSPGGTAVTGSMSGSDIFYVGQGPSTSAGFDFALGAVWIGSDAEGLGKAHLTALQSFLGL